MLILFGDTETTGLVQPLPTDLKFQPHIIEICLILMDKKKIVEEINTLIKPPIQIPYHITKITGIDDDMVKNAPKYKEVHKEIKFIFKKSDRFVAQNLMFDKRMFEIESERLKKSIPFPDDLYCTVEQNMHLEGYRLNSKELYRKATGKSIEGIHRAKIDVLAMIEYYRYHL